MNGELALRDRHDRERLDTILKQAARIDALEAALRLGCYLTACAGDGEYQIKIGFASLADMQTAHSVLVAALAPEQDK